MPEISHDALEEHLAKSGFSLPVCLIFGDEFLRKQALERVLAAVFPEDGTGDVEPLDGVSAGMAEALDRVRTFSLIPAPKVVVVSDARFFYTKSQMGAVFDAAKTAFDRRQMEKCAAGLMKLLDLLDLPLEKADAAGLLSRISSAGPDDGAWVKKALMFCREKGMEAAPRSDDARMLEAALDRGFPAKNHLVITADVVNRKHALFKLVADAGLAVNCAVARGESSFDKKEQEKVARAQITEILSRLGKTLAPEAFALVWENVGFDLFALSQSLKTAAAYAGDEKRITADHVRAVLVKTKQDPIFEFTSAFSERKTALALEKMNALLARQFHPLQLLSAMAGQCRGLLVARDFLASKDGGAFFPAMSYPAFNQRVAPLVKAFDGRLAGTAAQWQEALEEDSEDEKGGKRKSGGKKKGKTKKGATDLVLAKNPKSAYPVYKLLKNASRFSTQELVGGMLALKQVETRLKTGEKNPRILLEQFILSLAKTR